MKALRKLLFKILGVNGYLTIVRKSFFFAYNLGLLKSKPAIQWHYFVKNLIQPGDVVVDIGANLGYFSNTFCFCAGENGKVYSVEPVEIFRNQLKKQLSWSKNSTIYPYALGEENKDQIILGMPPSVRDLGYMRTGLPSILHGDEQQADGVNTFAAQLRKGSELFGDLTKIDYLKIDIEGYEWVVFQEMKALIASKKPMIQAECWPDNLDQTIQFFKELGYEAYKLQAGRLVNISYLQQQIWALEDTLFVPQEKIERIQHLI